MRNQSNKVIKVDSSRRSAKQGEADQTSQSSTSKSEIPLSAPSAEVPKPANKKAQTAAAAEVEFIGPDGERLTDVGNARRFATQHRDKVRYDYSCKCWYYWTGRRWKRDRSGVIERLAKKTVRRLYAQVAKEVDDHKRKELAAWARSSESRGRIASMIELAKSESGISVDPSKFDANPWLLNCQNGTLDLRTGKLLKHDPANLCTKLAPVEYDPRAKCPRWEEFLDEILAKDRNLISFLQRAAGYSLTGNTREQVIFIFWGKGRNGKTTFLETHRATLGDYAATADSSLLMTRRNDGVRNDVARLAGTRFVSTAETESERRMAEVFVKQLTGGDTVTARFLYSEFFEFESQFKVFLCTNHKPVIVGTDNAIWARIRLVPFGVTIPEDQQDKTLLQKLRAELPGILAWAVKGCLDWQKQGLGQPQKVVEATEAYRAEMDVVGAFLKERCTEGGGSKVQTGQLYDAYKEWCANNGESPLTQQKLGSALADRNFCPYRTGKARGWRGLALRDGGDKG